MILVTKTEKLSAERENKLFLRPNSAGLRLVTVLRYLISVSLGVNTLHLMFTHDLKTKIRSGLWSFRSYQDTVNRL